MQSKFTSIMNGVYLGKDGFCNQAKELIDGVLQILNRVIHKSSSGETEANEDVETELDYEDFYLYDDSIQLDPQNKDIIPTIIVDDYLLKDSPRSLNESQNKVRRILASVKDAVINLPLYNGYPTISWLPILPIDITWNLTKRCSQTEPVRKRKVTFFLEPVESDLDKLEREAKLALFKIKLRRQLIEELREEYLSFMSDRDIYRFGIGSGIS